MGHTPKFFTWADLLFNTSDLNVSFAELARTPGQIWDLKPKHNQINFHSFLFSVQSAQIMLLHYFPSWISMVI